MTTIALYSNKGGVGKTAAAVNLGYLAAESGRTTLVCDLDPRASATFYFRIQPKLSGKAKRLAGNPSAIEASIKGSDFDGLDLLDIEAGRASEVDVINGAIPREAAKVGLSAPVNQTLTGLVHAMEARARG